MMLTRPRVAALAVVLITAGLVAVADEAELEFNLGFGYDSNPFLSPDQAYFDQGGLTVVNPEPNAAPFIPVRLRGAYPVGSGTRRFVANLHLDADTYTASDTDNADEVYAKLSPGFDWQWRGRGRGDRSLWISPFLAYNKETYFDRDDGSTRQFGGEDLSGRYSYSAPGLEIDYRIDPPSRFEYAFNARFEKRDYDSVPDVLSQDHLYYRLGLDAEIEFSGRRKLYLDYRYRLRDYDTRPARNLEGRALSSNPDLEYTYHDLGLTLRLPASRRLDFYLDLDYRIREDGYLGYNDYRRASTRVRVVHKTPEGRRVALAVRRFETDYDRAFIFDLPTDPRDGSANPNKHYETIQVELEGEWPLADRWFVFGEYLFRDQDSEDPRWGYRRNQAAAGLKWKL